MVPALLLPLSFAPLGAYALGLGSLRVSSALGQPLNARIELIGATPAEAELATIGLASAEAHQRLGVDSSLGGVTLRFAVKVGGDGRSYVSVTSAQPVREPYIDFVVEAVSPTGQVAREYTILLDPVGSTAAPTTARATGWSPLVTPIPERTPPRPRANPFANVGLPKAGAVYGPVPPGATLWAIARRVQPDGADFDAVMSNIVRANPQAFINGDPARLKAGSRLSIPETQSLRAARATDALPTQDAAPVDSTPAATPAPPVEQPQKAAQAPAAEQAPDAEVRVLRSEDAKSATASAAAPMDASAGAGSNRIQLLEEALDAAQQQNESLQQRMGLLEEQIRTLTDLVKASPADSAGASGAAQSAAPAVAGPPTASPAVPAAAAPMQPPSPLGGGSAVYLTAAVTVLGLGGLLLWARRRRAAAAQPKSMFDHQPATAPDAAATSAGTAQTPATQVEWVEPVILRPAVAEPPAAVTAPTQDGFGDPVDTQIDLLTAYVGMADGASARQIYDEIQRAGTPAQKAQAAALLARLDA
jgi:pilus assembly protein FimV